MIIRGLIGVIILIIGFLLGVYKSPLQSTPDDVYYKFDKSINIAELVAVLVPLLVGFIVALYFQKPSDQKHLIKETLVSKINQIDTMLEDLVNMSRVDELSYAQAVSTSKRCTSAISIIFSNLDTYNINIKEKQEKKRKLDVCIHSLRGPLTDQPSLRSTKNNGLDVVGGMCKYSLSRITEIEAAVEKTRAELLNLVLSVQGNN